MIQTTIIPQNTTVHINIPNNYVGKKVHALIYIDEEITEAIIPITSQKPSDFFGTLSIEEGAKMHLHTIEARKEWNRDI
jgi:hypothetical protein